MITLFLKSNRLFQVNWKIEEEVQRVFIYPVTAPPTSRFPCYHTLNQCATLVIIDEPILILCLFQSSFIWCLIPFELLYIADQVVYKELKCISHNFGGQMSKISVPAQSARAFFCVEFLTLYPHMVKGARELSGISCI